MLKIKSISKSFQEDFWKKPVKVLDKVDLAIGEEKITGFVGKNGSGKTTSIKIMLGICKPDSGEIVYSTKLGHGRKQIFQNIGYLPENPRFFENLHGKSFLRYMAGLHGINPSTFSKRVNELAEILELTGALDKKIGKYSKGMRQKIGFIASIIHQPKLVILDEPLSGLDPKSRRIFKDIFKKVQSDGTSILLTSHILEDLFEVCDEIAHIKNGKIELKSFSTDNNARLVVELNSKPGFMDDSELIRSRKISGSKIVLEIDSNHREEVFKKLNIGALDILKMSTKPIDLSELE